jgi:hypothetical protein
VVVDGSGIPQILPFSDPKKDSPRDCNKFVSENFLWKSSVGSQLHPRSVLFLMGKPMISGCLISGNTHMAASLKIGVAPKLFIYSNKKIEINHKLLGYPFSPFF